MFINDVGENSCEEINDGIAGSNYGWPDSEGPTTQPRASRAALLLRARQLRHHRLRHHRGRLLQPGHAAVPASVPGPLLLRRLLLRLDPPASIPPNGTATAFATGISEPGGPRRWPGRQPLLPRARHGLRLEGRVHRPARRRRSPPIPSGLTVSAGQPAIVQRRRLRHGAPQLPVAAQRRRHPRRDRRELHARRHVAWPTTAPSSRPWSSNAFGSATSNGATLHVTANNPPVATITTPANQHPLFRGRHHRLRGHRHRSRGGRPAARARSPGRSTSTTTPTSIPSCPPPAAARAARSPSPTRARRRPTSGTAST